MIKRIICAIWGHNWSTTKFVYQKGMETFSYKFCIRCPKTTRYNIRKATRPLPPIDCNQSTKWKNWCGICSNNNKTHNSGQ